MMWQPRTWVAVVLAILFQPLAMLYLLRVKWALVYFLAVLLAPLVDVLLLGQFSAAWLRYVSGSHVVLIVCVIHAYRQARDFTPVSIRPWYSQWYGLLGILLVPVLAILMLRTFFFEPFSVPARSMLPGYPVGSYLIVQKWGYGNYRLFGLTLHKTEVDRPIERGDVIVFDYPENPRIQYFKRVVGLPGEQVVYRDKQLSINGRPAQYTVVEEGADYTIVRESLGEDSYFLRLSNYPPLGDYEVEVPQGHYFVLGDSRDNSRDSRHWGFLPQANIVGKVVYTIRRAQ